MAELPHPLVSADEKLEKAVTKLKKRLSDEGVLCQSELQEFESERQKWYIEQDYLKQQLTTFSAKVKHNKLKKLLLDQNEH